MSGAAEGQTPEVLLELEALRTAFDRAFRAAPPTAAQDAEDYVLIRAGGQGYALPAASLAGIEDCVRVVPVPSPVTALAGIAGVRGALVPVFDLAVLLAHGGAAAGDEEDGGLSVALVEYGGAGDAGSPVADGRSRCGQETQQIGLAFQTLERFVRVPAAAVYRPAAPGEPRTLHLADSLYAVLDLAALIAQLTGAAMRDPSRQTAQAAHLEDAP